MPITNHNTINTCYTKDQHTDFQQKKKKKTSTLTNKKGKDKAKLKKDKKEIKNKK